MLEVMIGFLVVFVLVLIIKYLTKFFFTNKYTSLLACALEEEADNEDYHLPRFVITLILLAALFLIIGILYVIGALIL
jgi:hypothetical protein